MRKIRKFLVRHRVVLANTVCGLAAGAFAALALLFSILFGYYQVSPQDAVDVTITPANIKGEKEDGSAITGFILDVDGNQYLITDYYEPIELKE